MVHIDNVLHNEFLKICICHYLQTYKSEINQHDIDRFGTPPESIIIAIGVSQKNDDWNPLMTKEAVYRYTKQDLQEVSTDTVPDCTENGMYFKEAYAELCYNIEGIAFMMIRYGKRYERCYRYSIKNEKGAISFSDEKRIWAS